MRDVDVGTRRRAALAVHDDRSGLLSDLADLLGCVVPFGAPLPDGARPDVVRLGIERRLLFIGDGKNTESPNCAATRARLTRYFAWARAHVETTRGTAIMAICFGDPWHAFGWSEVLRQLANEAQTDVVGYGREDFDERGVVVWTTLRAALA